MARVTDPDDPQGDVWDYNDIAEFYGVSTDLVRHWKHRNKLPPTLPRRKVAWPPRWSRASIESWPKPTQ
jgi:hypothetical protein